MLDHFHNLEEKRRLVDELLTRANAYLDGNIGPIETARSISRVPGLSPHDMDQDLKNALATFVVVDCETDALPVGLVRQYWNPDALQAEDAKIAKAELWCREMVADACRDLVKTLTPLLAELHDQHPKTP